MKLHIGPIPESICSLANLESLDLSYNQITGVNDQSPLYVLALQYYPTITKCFASNLYSRLRVI